MRTSVIQNIILATLIIVFLYTGCAKLLNFEAYKETITQSPILKPYAGVVVWMTPCVEFLIAFMLMNRKSRLIGFSAAFIVMILFTIYIVALHYFTDYIACSCGGIFESLPPGLHILLNICLTGIALAGVILNRGKRLQIFAGRSYQKA